MATNVPRVPHHGYMLLSPFPSVSQAVQAANAPHMMKQKARGKNLAIGTDVVKVKMATIRRISFSLARARFSFGLAGFAVPQTPSIS